MLGILLRAPRDSDADFLSFQRFPDGKAIALFSSVGVQKSAPFSRFGDRNKRGAHGSEPAPLLASRIRANCKREGGV